MTVANAITNGIQLKIRMYRERPSALRRTTEGGNRPQRSDNRVILSTSVPTRTNSSSCCPISRVIFSDEHPNSAPDSLRQKIKPTCWFLKSSKRCGFRLSWSLRHPSISNGRKRGTEASRFGNAHERPRGLPGCYPTDADRVETRFSRPCRGVVRLAERNVYRASSYVEVSSGTVAPPIACQAVIPPTSALASYPRCRNSVTAVPLI
jgi:hypothetical protein